MIDNNDFATIVDHRDPNRTPMQWDNSTNSGFTQGTQTWLPVHKNYKTVNVEVVKAIPDSIIHQFSELTSLRSNPTFLHGDFQSKAINDNVIAFVRKLEDHETFVSVANIGGTNATLNLTVFDNLPQKLKIVFVTSSSKFKIG